MNCSNITGKKRKTYTEKEEKKGVELCEEE